MLPGDVRVLKMVTNVVSKSDPLVSSPQYRWDHRVGGMLSMRHFVATLAHLL